MSHPALIIGKTKEWLILGVNSSELRLWATNDILLFDG